jgi:hypothetical protein
MTMMTLPLLAAVFLSHSPVGPTVNPVGTWSGRASVRLALGKTFKVQEWDRANKAKKMLEGLSFTAKFAANGTFEVTLSGLANNPPLTDTGSWSRVGNSIKTVQAKQSGHPGKQLIYLPSSDGKHLIVPIPARSGVVGNVIFSRTG